MKILDVPYFVQPTPITCQATCLKMFASYLARRSATSNPGASASIQEIWQEINTGFARPYPGRNSYRNMRWWLEQYFPSRRFEVASASDVASATRLLTDKVNLGYPVMVSTNHARTSGHIVLVVGYLGPHQFESGDIHFVCHDPYGKFDPQLLSKDYGRNRFSGGRSLLTGGESGPGKSVVYDIEGVRRSRKDKHSAGMFYMISGR